MYYMAKLRIPLWSSLQKCAVWYAQTSERQIIQITRSHIWIRQNNNYWSLTLYIIRYLLSNFNVISLVDFCNLFSNKLIMKENGMLKLRSTMTRFEIWILEPNSLIVGSKTLRDVRNNIIVIQYKTYCRAFLNSKSTNWEPSD